MKRCGIGLHHHFHHPARDPLRFLVVRSGVHLSILHHVAIGARDAERHGNEFHRRNQLRFWHAIQHFNVFIRLLDGWADRSLKVLFASSPRIDALQNDRKDNENRQC